MQLANIKSTPQAQFVTLSECLEDPFKSDIFCKTAGTLLRVDQEIIASIPNQVFARTHLSPHTIGILANSHSTNGALGVLAMTHAKNFGPPLHTHNNEDELFYIRSGDYLFQVGDKIEKIQSGTFVYAPKGIAHTFLCLSDTGRTFVFVTPAGFEQYFFDIAQIGDNDFKRQFLEISSRYGITPVGPPINPEATFWDAK